MCWFRFQTPAQPVSHVPEFLPARLDEETPLPGPAKISGGSITTGVAGIAKAAGRSSIEGMDMSAKGNIYLR